MDVSVIREISGPSPDDRTELVTLKPNLESLKSLTEIRNTSKIYEYFYNVCGIVPPVNNIGYHERDNNFPDNWGGLLHAQALFRGIKRPYIDGNRDEDIYVYIVKPRYIYKYQVHMVCPAERIDAPEGAVFAVYVVFSPEKEGEILGWEWVEADTKDPDLPAGFTDRYQARVW